jgi:hypothetical protein
MNSSLPRLTTVVILIAAAAIVAARARNKPAHGEAAATQVPQTSAFPATVGPRISSVEQSPSPASVGDKLLVQVATQLNRRSSVSARLRHQVFIGDSPLYGVGSYWQQGSGSDLKVRLELQFAGQEASLLQVSNNRFLWIDRQLPTGRSLSRVDLRQVRADPILSARSAEELEPGEANWSAVQPELIAHSGGLPSLLASLGENFSFLPPQAMRLAAQVPSDSQPASIPVFAVVGHWRAEKLAALVGRGSEPSGDRGDSKTVDAHLSSLNSLPDRLPQEVLLIVGQGDLFPYRIEYRRLETPLAGGEGSSPIPFQLSPNPLVVLELTDVAFDVTIAAGQFDYAPGDADWVDQTAKLLERLRRERETHLAGRGSGDPNTLPAR